MRMGATFKVSSNWKNRIATLGFQNQVLYPPERFSHVEAHMCMDRKSLAWSEEPEQFFLSEQSDKYIHTQVIETLCINCKNAMNSSY